LVCKNVKPTYPSEKLDRGITAEMPSTRKKSRKNRMRKVYGCSFLTRRVRPLEQLKNMQVFGQKRIYRTILTKTRRKTALIGPMFEIELLDSYPIV
jgi:hypothetical protein